MLLLATFLASVAAHGAGVLPSSPLASSPAGPLPRFHAAEWSTGAIWLLGTSDRSRHLVGYTGVAGLGGLELAPDGQLYAMSFSPGPQLYRIDPRTAEATALFLIQGEIVFEGGLALSHTGEAWATNVVRGGFDSALLSLDLTGRRPTEVVGVIGYADINGLALRSDGMLVGLDGVSNALVTIDPDTAHMEPLAVLGPRVGAAGGMTLVGDSGYFTASGIRSTIPGGHELWSFDPFTGEHALVAPLPDGFTGSGISGLSAAAVGPRRCAQGSTACPPGSSQGGRPQVPLALPNEP